MESDYRNNLTCHEVTLDMTWTRSHGKWLEASGRRVMIIKDESLLCWRSSSQRTVFIYSFNSQFETKKINDDTYVKEGWGSLTKVFQLKSLNFVSCIITRSSFRSHIVENTFIFVFFESSLTVTLTLSSPSAFQVGRLSRKMVLHFNHTLPSLDLLARSCSGWIWKSWKEDSHIFPFTCNRMQNLFFLFNPFLSLSLSSFNSLIYVFSWFPWFRCCLYLTIETERGLSLLSSSKKAHVVCFIASLDY